MQFKINRSNFVEALKAAADVSGANALAILSNVKLETEGEGTLVVTGTNLDVVVVRRVECQVKVGGKIAAPAKFLLSAVSAMTAPDVEFTVDENVSNAKAKLTGGDSSFKMVTMPESEFPKAATVEGEEFKIESAKFITALKKVAYAACPDDTRRSLKGVNIAFENGKVTFVGTDGRRLSLVETDLDGAEVKTSFILPDVAVKYALKVFGQKDDETIKVVSSRSGAVFTSDTAVLQTKLVDETYPNYRQVIPGDSKFSVEIDRQQILDAVRLVSISAENESPRVTLEFKDGVLTVASMNSDISDAKTVLPVKFDGEKVLIGLSPRYLIDVFNCLVEDDITLKFSNATSPLVITDEAAGFLGVIMPLRFV